MKPDPRHLTHGWRLWAIIGGVVVVIAVVAKFSPASLPLLLLLACPLSMMFMMGGMSHAHGSDPQHAVRSTPQSPLSGLERLPYDEQVRLLRTRLLSVQAEGDVLADTLERMQGGMSSSSREASKPYAAPDATDPRGLLGAAHASGERDSDNG